MNQQLESPCLQAGEYVKLLFLAAIAVSRYPRDSKHL
jgi:hypothetical protein